MDDFVGLGPKGMEVAIPEGYKAYEVLGMRFVFPDALMEDLKQHGVGILYLVQQMIEVGAVLWNEDGTQLMANPEAVQRGASGMEMGGGEKSRPLTPEELDALDYKNKLN